MRTTFKTSRVRLRVLPDHLTFQKARHIGGLFHSRHRPRTSSSLSRNRGSILSFSRKVCFDFHHRIGERRCLGNKETLPLERGIYSARNGCAGSSEAHSKVKIRHPRQARDHDTCSLVIERRVSPLMRIHRDNARTLRERRCKRESAGRQADGRTDFHPYRGLRGCSNQEIQRTIAGG